MLLLVVASYIGGVLISWPSNLSCTSHKSMQGSSPPNSQSVDVWGIEVCVKSVGRFNSMELYDEDFVIPGGNIYDRVAISIEDSMHKSLLIADYQGERNTCHYMLGPQRH